MLQANKLSVNYQDIQAVADVDFTVEQGELISIIGANGAGKTSILNALMGITPLKSGQIQFNGHDITGKHAHQRARDGIRIVPERARVFPRLSVLENLMTGVYGLKRTLDWQPRLGWLYTLFPVLKTRQNQLAITLSGGEQQQLAIARALVSDPKLLLVDEVSMGLMPKLAQQVFALLAQLNREHGLTILLVEQNAMASLQISKRAYVLETGRIVFSGPAEALLNDERIKSAYLG